MLSSAQASCAATGNPSEITQFVGGNLVAREVNVAGTCNSDGTYRGTIGDRREDGVCAQAIFRDAGVVNVQAFDCSANNGPVEYSFNDRNGNNRAEIKVCIEGTCAGAPWFEIRGY